MKEEKKKVAKLVRWYVPRPRRGKDIADISEAHVGCGISPRWRGTTCERTCFGSVKALYDSDDVERRDGRGGGPRPLGEWLAGVEC